MLPRAKKRSASRREVPRGQATIEYSIVSWLLVVGLVLGCTVRIIPGPRQQQSALELFLNAYQTYYDSFHFVLGSPFP